MRLYAYRAIDALNAGYCAAKPPMAAAGTARTWAQLRRENEMIRDGVFRSYADYLISKITISG